MHYAMLVKCLIDPLILYSKVNIIKKDVRRHRKKALNSLKLITKQEQVQVMKDL